MASLWLAKQPGLDKLVSGIPEARGQSVKAFQEDFQCALLHLRRFMAHFGSRGMQQQKRGAHIRMQQAVHLCVEQTEIFLN